MEFVNVKCTWSIGIKYFKKLLRLPMLLHFFFRVKIAFLHISLKPSKMVFRRFLQKFITCWQRLQFLLSFVFFLLKNSTQSLLSSVNRIDFFTFFCLRSWVKLVIWRCGVQRDSWKSILYTLRWLRWILTSWNSDIFKELCCWLYEIVCFGTIVHLILV